MADSLKLQLRRFTSNQNITVEGKHDKEEFYIVRRGRVAIASETNVVTGGEPTILGEGDYFGLLSCMTGHSRTETADAYSDCELIVVPRTKFESFTSKHPTIVKRVVSKLSRDLRFYDEEIGKRTHGEDENKADSGIDELYSIGDYYYQKKAYNQAIYAFTRYLQHLPEGPKAGEAAQRIQSMSAAARNAMNSQNEEGSLIRTYRPDTFLFCEHEPGNEAFIIQEGSVKIVKIERGAEVQLAVLGAPSIIGEMSILENKPRNASGIAAGEVKVLAVSKDNFDTMMSSQPAMTHKIISTISERIWVAYRQLANILMDDPMSRLWDRLLIEVEKTHTPIKKGAQFTTNFGPVDLLNMIGISQDEGKHFIRQIFEDKKAVELRDGIIQILDTDAVQKQVTYYKNLRERERKLKKKS